MIARPPNRLETDRERRSEKSWELPTLVLPRSSVSPRSSKPDDLAALRLALVTDVRTWHLRFENRADLWRWAALLAPYASLTNNAEPAPEGP